MRGDGERGGEEGCMPSWPMMGIVVEIEERKDEIEK